MPYPGCLNVRTVGSLRHPSLRHPTSFRLLAQDALVEVVARDALAEIVAPGQLSKCRGYVGGPVARVEQKNTLSQDAFNEPSKLQIGLVGAHFSSRLCGAAGRHRPRERCNIHTLKGHLGHNEPAGTGVRP